MKLHFLTVFTVANQKQNKCFDYIMKENKRTKMRSSCTLLENTSQSPSVIYSPRAPRLTSLYILHRGENLYCRFSTGLCFPVSTLLWTRERLQIISPLSSKL